MNDSRRPRSRTWLFSGAAALGLLIGAAGVATAANDGGALPLRHGSEQEARGPEGETLAAPGAIDDGAELLPQAGITVEQALAAAQSAATGAIGEVDIEYYHGTLVFNVDVGDQDVKVDASSGAVVGVGAD